MSYAVEFKKSARRELLKLPFRIQNRVLEAIQVIRSNPLTEILKIKKLKGAPNLYRLRLGDYRVVYEIVESKLIVIVIKIGHRKEVYRKL